MLLKLQNFIKIFITVTVIQENMNYFKKFFKEPNIWGFVGPTFPLQALNSYFIPKKKVNYEIFKFRETVRQPHESLNQFYAKRHQLALTCNFNSIDDEINRQIISKCSNRK